MTDLNSSRRRRRAAALGDGAPTARAGDETPTELQPGWTDPAHARSWWRLLPADWTAPCGWGEVAIRDRHIFDLCGGSGSWSEPYRAAGYPVTLVELPIDVRTWVPPRRPWGILAAPPCEQFSRARRAERSYVVGMETVNACLRLILQCRPMWWALENPWHGDLAKFIGAPTWTFHPWQFGDPWTKPTAIWGEFRAPTSRVFVEPDGSAMDRATPNARAVTPPGFARAFCEANP